jgi:hypothetical protein
VPADQYREAIRRWEEIRASSRSAYEWLTGEEIARELARIDLPLSTYTQWYWKIDLHNLLHFLKLRVDAHAQWEIQEYGRVMAGMLQRVAPLSYEAWIDYDVCGDRLSRMELDALRKLILVGEAGQSAGGGDRTGTGQSGAAGDRTGTAALSARDGTRLEGTAFTELGLSKREIGELIEKLRSRTVPDFKLDPSQASPPEAFAERFAKAVPSVDKAPAD